MKRQTTIDIISFLLILLWTYASMSKLVIFEEFRNQLLKQPIPKWSVDILHGLLPISEISLAIFLAFQRTRRVALLSSFLVMTTFTFYVAFAMMHLFGSIPCSCGGIFRKMGWSSHFFINIVFTVISFIGWILQRRQLVPTTPRRFNL